MDRAKLDPDRAHAALELLTRHEPALRRAARRVSICATDADDAVQRAFEILLTRTPPAEPARLLAWMTVVTRHEALAVRRARERLLSRAWRARPERVEDPLDSTPSDRPGPAERAERAEETARVWSALNGLKPDERRAILLQAGGYSYSEICATCGWTYTKVNRCLAEGRAALRRRAPLAPDPS